MMVGYVAKIKNVKNKRIVPFLFIYLFIYLFISKTDCTLLLKVTDGYRYSKDRFF